MNLPVVDMPLPIRFRPPTPMTDDELLVFCERNDVVWIEREADGDIRIRPIPGGLVGGIKMEIALDLHLWSESTGRGEVLSGIGFSLPDGSMLGAYVAWLRKDKLSRLTVADRIGFPHASPDFVVEIDGPFDEPGERKAKVEIWLANGVELVWLIGAKDKSVTIYRPGAEPEHHTSPISVQGTGPIAGFELVLARIWE
jgi:Uma2 family endonuclease